MSNLYNTSYDIIHIHKQLSVSFNSNTTDITCIELKLPSRLEHLILPRCFSGVRVAPFLIFCVVFCGSMFVRLFPFLWSLCYLSFKLRFLITNLVSSNSSYNIRMLTLLFVDEIIIII